MTTLPGFTCAPGCSACCTVVPFSSGDKARIAAVRPDLSWQPFEDRWLLAKAVETMRCPLLQDGRCSIHGTDAYPMVCRLYGIVDHPRMTCHMGGKGTGRISDARAKKLIRRSG